MTKSLTIKKKNPLSKTVTITDVARLAQVSRTAVSQVLNNAPIRISDKKRQLILDTAKRLHYQPHIGARRLVLQKWETLALLFPDQPKALFQLYIFELIRELVAAAHNYSYDILLDYVHSVLPAAFDPNAGKVDGTIVISDYVSPKELIRHLEQCGHPYVVLGDREPSNRQENYVGCDVEHGIYELTRHLLDLGHRHIAFFSGVPSPAKLAGYKRALSEAGIRTSRQLLFDSGIEEEAVSRSLREMVLLKDRPTALVATNDILAIRMCSVLKNFGYSVPADFSITGFDDIELSQLVKPALTTSHIPVQDLAAACVKQLVTTIESRSLEPIHVVLKPSIVVRGSTGSVPRRR